MCIESFLFNFDAFFLLELIVMKTSPIMLTDFLFLTFETNQFLFLAMWDFLVQDKKITCVLPANACYTVYVNCPPNYPCFSFLK